MIKVILIARTIESHPNNTIQVKVIQISKEIHRAKQKKLRSKGKEVDQELVVQARVVQKSKLQKRKMKKNKILAEK